VRDAQPRQVADLRGLLGDRERAGDDGLRGDNRGGGQENTMGSRAQPGASRKNGLLMALGSARISAPWPR
jgi:hypothetical protein